jgi:2-phospho-L-lactate guanylyltransferase (CobY/MobA/RfbA family)
MMAEARQAITQDIIERAQSVPGISKIVLSTNAPSLAEWAQRQGVATEADPPGKAFHFGERLREIALKHQAEGLFYVGGGSAALLQADEMARIAERVRSADRILITNNFYSTDFAAFAPLSALDAVEPPSLDNDLGWALAEKAGLPNESLHRTAATQLDVDTPTDLMALAYHPGVGSHTRTFLDRLELDASPIERAMQPLVDRDAEVLVAGRVSAAVWQYLERETACRIRVFAEERGMRASGRQARGQVRSLLGYHYQQVGSKRFFETLAELGRAVILDSRVVFAHLGVWPPDSERFNSDLYRPDRIPNEVVRQFTEAAMEAPVPVVLGGHSLVSGALYALVEAAWACSGVDVPRYVDHTVWGQASSGPTAGAS